jgi:copper chaperone CopZ
MEKTTVELPSMYGDHHVIEVRRILLEIPGVEDVNASSGFQLVEVDYDPEKTEAADIKAKLEEAGYTQDLSVAAETGEAAYKGSNGDSNEFFRHTAVFEQTQQGVSFTQEVSYTGRPLWPCPGMGVVTQVEIDE